MKYSGPFQDDYYTFRSLLAQLCHIQVPSRTIISQTRPLYNNHFTFTAFPGQLSHTQGPSRTFIAHSGPFQEKFKINKALKEIHFLFRPHPGQ
jgi:hypothetical protein